MMFKLVTAVPMNTEVQGDVTRYQLEHSYRAFGGIMLLHISVAMPQLKECNIPEDLKSSTVFFARTSFM
jgi:hypothetical protein